MRIVAIVFAVVLVCIPSLACNSGTSTACAGNCQGCAGTTCCDHEDQCLSGHTRPGQFCSKHDQICP